MASVRELAASRATMDEGEFGEGWEEEVGNVAGGWFTCGGKGHWKWECPMKGKGSGDKGEGIREASLGLQRNGEREPM